MGQLKSDVTKAFIFEFWLKFKKTKWEGLILFTREWRTRSAPIVVNHVSNKHWNGFQSHFCRCLGPCCFLLFMSMEWDDVSELWQTTDLYFISEMIWVWRLGGCYWQIIAEKLGEKSVPVPLCPQQIPRGLTRVRTLASALRSRRLCAWAMTRALHGPLRTLSPWWKQISAPNCRLAGYIFAINLPVVKRM
jgi:hypothetical protein